MTEEKREYGTISLPLPLINSVKEKIKGTGMHSVSAYVTFILRQILSSQDTIDSTNLLNKETEEEIKNRLKKLGYI
jgi:hypothetical protein